MRKSILALFTVAALNLMTATAFADWKTISCDMDNALILSQFKADISTYPVLTNVFVWSYNEGNTYVARNGQGSLISEEALALQADPQQSNSYILADDADHLSFYFDRVGDSSIYLLLPRDIQKTKTDLNLHFKATAKSYWSDREGRVPDETTEQTVDCWFSY